MAVARYNAHRHRKDSTISKPEPGPSATEFSRFDAAISQAEVDKRIAREKRAKEKKRKAG